METTNTTTNQTPTERKIQDLQKNHLLLKTFMSYYGQDQQGKTEYEIGCIQTANILAPVILELLFND
jgi:hypothetical protein